MKNYIDHLFRGYGEEFFGKEAMDKITDKQVETARIYSFKTLNDVCKEVIKSGDKESLEIIKKSNILKELFFNYIFSEYM